MDLSLILHNGSLSMVEQQLSTETSLAHGAAAYQLAEGSEQDRLRVAISAMVARLKKPVDHIRFDGPLEDYTVPQLRRIAEEHNVYVYSSDRKDDIICKLQAEQRRRHEYS